MATLLIPETNVGGYRNTGWDLVSNLIGATTAATWIWVSERRRAPAPDTVAVPTDGTGDVERCHE